MSAAVLSHPRFQRPPVASRPRRGKLPRGVVSITSVERLRVGVIAEVFESRQTAADNGKRMRITDFDLSKDDGYQFECTSLDGPIECEGGLFETFLLFKPTELRRMWTGLTERERILLRFWRSQ